MGTSQEIWKHATSSTSFPGGVLSGMLQDSFGSIRTRSSLELPKEYPKMIYCRNSSVEKVHERENGEYDPEDERTKQYLESHFAELGLPGKQPIQMFADLKVSEVLTRGTIAENKMRARLNQLKETLPPRKLMTIDYQEALKVIKDVNQRVEELNNLKSRKEQLEDTKALIETVFNAETLCFDENGSEDVVDVRALLAGLDSSTSDDEGSSDDLACNLIAPTNLREPSIKKTDDRAVLERELAMALKKQIYLTVKGLVASMRADQNLMKHKLFRIWVTRQEEALDFMKNDVDYDDRVGVNLKLIQEEKLTDESRNRGGKSVEDKRDGDLDGGPCIKDNIWRRSLGYIHEREKLMEDECDGSFLLGVLNGELQVERHLKKRKPPMVGSTKNKNFGPLPLAIQANEKVMRALGSCLESKMRLMSYGDLIRLLNGDGSFTIRSETPGENDCVEQDSSETTTTSSEIDTISKDYVDETCPILTRSEFDRFNQKISEEVFPDPNFPLLETVLSFDENAFAIDKGPAVSIDRSLQEVESETLKSLNLTKYLSRSIYFFKYKSDYSAAEIRNEFENYILQNNAMSDEQEDHPNGCLLLYSNVALGIVMIEGKPLHVFNHFAGLRYSKAYPLIEDGRILYVEENVTELIFSLWVSILAAPATGKVSYSSKSKKVLNRVAKPRAEELKKNLHKLYRKIAKSDSSKMQSGSNFTEHLNLLFEKCACHRPKKTVDGTGEFPSLDLLPSPAILAYLLKFRKLKSIDRFLDELFMQPILESDDETYDVAESSVLSNYIDSDDENCAQDILRQMKRAGKDRKVIGELHTRLKANLTKEAAKDGKPAWTCQYDVKAFTPKLDKVQIRPVGGDNASTITVESLAESDENVLSDENEQLIDLGPNAKSLTAWRKFANFVETGSEAWQKKVKWLGLPGREVKEMLRDAHMYRELRKAVVIRSETKSLSRGSLDEEDFGEERIEDEVEEEGSHMKFEYEMYGEGAPEAASFPIGNFEELGEFHGFYGDQILGEYKSEMSGSLWAAQLKTYKSVEEYDYNVEEQEMTVVNSDETTTSEVYHASQKEQTTIDGLLLDEEDQTANEVLFINEGENEDGEIILTNEEEQIPSNILQINHEESRTNDISFLNEE